MTSSTIIVKIKNSSWDIFLVAVEPYAIAAGNIALVQCSSTFFGVVNSYMAWLVRRAGEHHTSYS